MNDSIYRDSIDSLKKILEKVDQGEMLKIVNSLDTPNNITLNKEQIISKKYQSQENSIDFKEKLFEETKEKETGKQAVENKEAEHIKPKHVIETTTDLKEVLDRHKQPVMKEKVEEMTESNPNDQKQIDNELEKSKEKKEKARATIADKLGRLDSGSASNSKMSSLDRLIDMAREAGIMSEFIGQFAEIANKISSENIKSGQPSSVLSAQNAEEIEKEKQRQFDNNFNDISNIFKGGKLDENKYDKVVNFMDNEDNRKRLNKKTQPCIDNLQALRKKEEKGELSKEQQQAKAESEKQVSDHYNSHICHNVHKHGKASGISKKDRIDIANQAIEDSNNTPNKFVEIKNTDQLNDLASSDAIDAINNHLERKKDKAIDKQPLNQELIKDEKQTEKPKKVYGTSLGNKSKNKKFDRILNENLTENEIRALSEVKDKGEVISKSTSPEQTPRIKSLNKNEKGKN